MVHAQASCGAALLCCVHRTVVALESPRCHPAGWCSAGAAPVVGHSARGPPPRVREVMGTTPLSPASPQPAAPAHRALLAQTHVQAGCACALRPPRRRARSPADADAQGACPRLRRAPPAACSAAAVRRSASARPGAARACAVAAAVRCVDWALGAEAPRPEALCRCSQARRLRRDGRFWAPQPGARRAPRRRGAAVRERHEGLGERSAARRWGGSYASRRHTRCAAGAGRVLTRVATPFVARRVRSLMTEATTQPLPCGCCCCAWRRWHPSCCCRSCRRCRARRWRGLRPCTRRS